MKSIKHQQRLFQLAGGIFPKLIIIDQRDQGANVVPAVHITQ